MPRQHRANRDLCLADVALGSQQPRRGHAAPRAAPALPTAMRHARGSPGRRRGQPAHNDVPPGQRHSQKRNPVQREVGGCLRQPPVYLPKNQHRPMAGDSGWPASCVSTGILPPVFRRGTARRRHWCPRPATGRRIRIDRAKRPTPRAHSQQEQQWLPSPRQVQAPPTIARMLPVEQDRHLNRAAESRPTAP